MKNPLFDNENIEMSYHGRLLNFKKLVSLNIPVSIFCEDIPVEQIISTLNDIFDNNIKIIDFDKISDYKQLLSKLSSDSSIYIFTNIESISKMKDCEIIGQSIYFMIDNDEYIYREGNIDFSSFKKICIYKNRESIEDIIRIDWIYNKTFVITL